jgi:predicted nucleotidyltransferase
MEKIHNTSKDKILKLLLSNKRREFTVRAISRNVLVDYKTVHMAVKELIGSKTIHAKRAGQSILCSINQKEFSLDIFRAELIRKNELFKNKDLRALSGYFKEIKSPFFIILLFGSYASGKARKGSDIDLMLITDSGEITKRAKQIISTIPLDIHLSDFDSRSFLSMLKTTEFNVGKEAAANNVILFGIEAYYKLVQNA